VVSALSGGRRPPFFFTCARRQAWAPPVPSVRSLLFLASLFLASGNYGNQARSGRCSDRQPAGALQRQLSTGEHLRYGHRQARLRACAGLRAAGRATRAQAALHQLLPAQRLLGGTAVIPARTCTAQAVSPLIHAGDWKLSMKLRGARRVRGVEALLRAQLRPGALLRHDVR